MWAETQDGRKLTLVSPLDAEVTQTRSPDTASSPPALLATVSSPLCGMAESLVWIMPQDGSQTCPAGSGPSPNCVWISLIAGELTWVRGVRWERCWFRSGLDQVYRCCSCMFPVRFKSTVDHSSADKVEG